MAAYYDTAGDIVNSAAVECGLDTTGDPFSSPAPHMVQMCSLLTNCGRELYNKYQWQQFIENASYDTDTDIIVGTTNEFALPDDFAFLINQTGWTPNNLGLGLPLGGPYTEQQWDAIVAQQLAASTIYIGFKIADGTFQVLPDPPPANTTITFGYMSRNWVQVEGVAANGATKVENSSDIVMFEPVMVVKMLAARYKQAKGLDATDSLDQFNAAFNSATSLNSPAPVLDMGRSMLFPLLNIFTNTPPTGYGS